jgi:hypothetical protein
MSIVSNHRPEIIDELNGQTCEPSEADWLEYAAWSAGLDQQLPDPQPDPEPPKPSKPARTRKPRGKKQRTFKITFSIDGTDYKVFPLTIDPSIGTKAFRFCKQDGNGEVYDLHADAFGLQCQCKGFVAHGHCKHTQTIQAAGKLFNLLAS